MDDIKEIKEFKEVNKENMLRFITLNGNLQPMCTVLVHKDDKYKAIIAPIPGECFEDAESKQKFLHIMPLFFKTLEEKQDYRIVCFSISTECWLRKTPKELGIPKDWRELPKTEALSISYETEDSSTVEIYDIIRDGMIANEDGDLIDCIKLEKNADLQDNNNGLVEGTLSNIYRNYVKSKTTKDE